MQNGAGAPRGPRRRLRILLWDLDGTLAAWDGPGIVVALAGRFLRLLRPHAAPLPALLAAGRAYLGALRNPGPRSNDAVFNARLAAALRLPCDLPARLARTLLADGAADDLIAAHIAAIPAARELVAAVAAHGGVRQVVATNPVMPSLFNRRRLELAGYDVAGCFVHVTGSELHSGQKHRVAFYEQLLAQLGAAPGDCLMVGNDLAKDLVAKEAGIPMFLIENAHTRRRGGPAGLAPDGSGDYDALRAWILA